MFEATNHSSFQHAKFDFFDFWLAATSPAIFETTSCS
jgi:hypothetical protein